MFLATITMVHTAESLEALNRDTKAIQGTALENLCQIGALKFQQIDGLNTVLPAGGKHISINRTLTTEALTAFMPFRVQEVQHEHGIYYGQNVKSKNMILADRRKLLNGNSFILGVSGSGKSFAAKSEITNIMLSTDADIIIVDPEREYAPIP
jgi:type IV secretory pathway VirB4 component